MLFCTDCKSALAGVIEALRSAKGREALNQLKQIDLDKFKKFFGDDAVDFGIDESFDSQIIDRFVDNNFSSIFK
jgi:hypothetical protein